MKKTHLSLIILLFLPFFTFAQNITCVEIADTVKITVQSYRGDIQWQKSFNNLDWENIEGENESLLVYVIELTPVSFRAKITEGTCDAFYSDYVEIFGAPVVFCPENMSFCINTSPIYLNGGDPEGGSYSGNGVSAGIFNASMAGLGTHEITYNYTDENGCNGSCIFTITVYALPEVVCADDMSVCAGAAPISLSGCTPAGGIYSGTGVSGGIFDPTSAGTGTHTITYSYTDGNTCMANCTFTITVHALPEVVCADDMSVCAGAAPISLSGCTPAGGIYSGTGVSGDIFDPTSAGTGTHTIIYSYTDGNTCMASCTFTITVHALPEVVCADDISVCTGAAPISLSGCIPAGGIYSGTGVSGGIFDPSSAGTGTHTITYSYTDGNTCMASCTFTITVHALPEVVCADDISVCTGAAPISLSGCIPAGGIYSGTGVSGGIFDPTSAGTGTHTITYSYTDGNTCMASCTFTITVHALPEVVCADDMSVCAGAAPISLSGCTPAGGIYSGTGVSGGIFDPTSAGTGTHSITYSYTDGNTCMASCTFTITVYALPEVVCADDMSVCAGAAPISLNGCTPAGGIYSGTGVSGGIFTASVAGAGTHEITYIYTDGNACSNSCSFDIFVDAIQIISQPQPGTICTGGEQLLSVTASSIHSLTYQWQYLSGSSWLNISGQTSSTFAGHPTSNRQYRVIIIPDGSTCGNVTSAAALVTVRPDPAISTQPVGATKACGGSHAMSVVATGGTPVLTYQWQSSLNGSTWVDITGATNNTYATGAIYITTHYRVIVASAGNGCDSKISNVAILTITPDASISVQPLGATIACGSSHTMSVTASGGIFPLQYQWQQSSNGSIWADVSGANADTYNTGALNVAVYYRVIITAVGSSCPPITSNTSFVAMVNVPAAPTAANHIPFDDYITWNWHPAALATGYKYNITNDYGSATDLGSDTTFTQTGLSCEVSYTLYVWAYNSCGNSTACTLTKTSFPCGCGIFTDVEDNEYRTVVIGTQCWFRDNLRTTKYRNGTSIANVTDDAEWASLITPAYSWYNNDPANYSDTIGALYNWYAVNTGVICPTGWHVPSDEEWTILSDYLSDNGYSYDSNPDRIAKSLTSTTRWVYEPVPGCVGNNMGTNNSSGFTAYPSGFRTTFFAGFVYSVTHFWSSTEVGSTTARDRGMASHTSYFIDNDQPKYSGFSVRCVKDSPPEAPTSGIHISSDLQIEWNWNSVSNVTGYKYNTVNDYVTASDNGTAISFTQSGLTCNTAYTLYVWAYNPYGYSLVCTLTQTTDYCNCGTIADVDGNLYQTVTIGTQCWMRENLKTSKYKNGTDIPYVTDNTAWSALTNGAYCWYNNDEVNYGVTYGALYNFYAGSTGNLCPEGWHVPSNGEWATLVTYLGGASVAGGKLKETGTSHWNSPNNGATNIEGFTALPGGIRFSDGGYTGMGTNASWWTSTVANATWSYLTMIMNTSSLLTSDWIYNTRGHSIRCVKN